MAKKTPLVISHWYHLIEVLAESSQQFYSSIEQAIDRRQIPDVTHSRVDFKEGGIFSAKREYLEVKGREHVFEICAAPYARGFFISWWLAENEPGFLWQLILKIPLLGMYFFKTFHTTTFYSMDTALMFQETIRSAVLEVVDDRTTKKGLRALSELERKPIMSSLFQK